VYFGDKPAAFQSPVSLSFSEFVCKKVLLALR